MPEQIRRIIDIHWNHELGFRVTSADKTKRNTDVLVLSRGENCLLRWNFYDASGAQTGVEASATFEYGVATSFADPDNPQAVSGNGEFLSGDWGSYDLATGKICGRLDLNTVELENALGEATSSDAYLVFWGFTPSLAGGAMLMANVKIKIENVPSNPGGATLLSPAYVSVDWTSTGTYDLAVHDPFGLSKLVLYDGGGDMTGLVYKIGTPADDDAFEAAGNAFSGMRTYEVDELVSGGTIRLTITTGAASGTGSMKSTGVTL